jgi:peptidoglycan/LPS O-acetylase OafA/YrhL
VIGLIRLKSERLAFDSHILELDQVTTRSAFARYKATQRFQSLDALRAFAIVAVIWHHTFANAFSSPIAYEGRHGVKLFFVISGFLIVTLMLRSQEGPHGFSLMKFWGRRALRILPIYYTVLAVYVVLVRLTDHSPAAADFFHNLPYFATFTSNWFVSPSDRTIFFFSWSLASEEQFYLLWPLVEVLIPSRRLKLALLGVLAIASQVAIANSGMTLDSSLPSRILTSVALGLLLGTGLAHALNNKSSFALAYRLIGRRGSALGCAAFVIVTAIVSPYLDAAGDILVTVALLLLVASTVIREDNDLAGALRWQPVVWVGTVSYGMYMLHMLSVNVVRRGMHVAHIGSSAIEFIVAAALACALASLSFLYYERKFLVLKDRFFRD